MNVRITEIRGDGIPSIVRVNAFEVLRHLVESFVPADTLPTVWSATHGISQAVFVVVNVLQGDGFRADVAAAERIVFVAADLQALVTLHGDFDAADRFADIAVAIMRRAGHGRAILATKSTK